MECAKTWDRLSAYLDGDLPEQEREGIAQHLRKCARCAAEERALKETLSLPRTPPLPAAVGAGKPDTAAGTRENRQRAGAPARPPTEGSDRETGKKETRRQTAAAMPEEKKPAGDCAPRLETSAGPAKTERPSVPPTPR